MTVRERSMKYVAATRRTGQYRKSYWYIVVFDIATGNPIGHQTYTTRNRATNRALRDFNGNSYILKGSEA